MLPTKYEIRYCIECRKLAGNAYFWPLDEFRGPRSDYVRQVALEATTTTDYACHLAVALKQ
ncbi:hypothetical protein TNCV_2963351 [Trichonephila clavipes]|nr:hypothetical protein TNCV_2963351 [Trichonephila clavipes]